MYQRLGTGGLATPGNGPVPKHNFRARQAPYSFTVRGVTRDVNLAPLGGAIVRLFRTSDNEPVGAAISDRNGNYAIAVPDNTTTYYAVAYLSSSPDVEGTTPNTLVAS